MDFEAKDQLMSWLKSTEERFEKDFSSSGGACALLLASEKAVLEHSLDPIAQILAHSDVAMESIDFIQAVVLAIEKLFKKTGIDQHQVAQWVGT